MDFDFTELPARDLYRLRPDFVMPIPDVTPYTPCNRLAEIELIRCAS
ncbi:MULTISPECIES: hypothetical protein [unclassified Ensifer]|nr:MULTISPECIES: hypothetical protein [unclassified Ensifer]